MTGRWDEVTAAAAATLADLPAVVAKAQDAVRERVPEYTFVSDEHLLQGLQRNLAGMLASLRDQRPLEPHELADFETTVVNRARAGVPLDRYLLAVATAESSMWEQFTARFSADGDREQVIGAFALRFANVETVTRVTATAHRRVELLNAREDQERRALALGNLLGGNLEASELREHAARLGLDADRPYVVVRARGRGDLDSDQVQRRIARQRNFPPYAVFVLSGEDVVGLVADLPSSVTGLIAGVAGPAMLSGLPRAHALSQLAFSTAWSLGQEGLVSADQLGLRIAVHSSPELGRALRQKYLAPLQASASLGGDELFATVRAYLESGGHREAAATQMHVHANTVGYRIGRFTELTGAELTDLATLAELWWLFTDDDMQLSQGFEASTNRAS